MSGNEINKGKIYVAYITMLGIPELTYALAYVVDEASANGVKVVAKHTSANIGWAKQDIRRVYNLEKYKELFPQGYEMIDLDEIKIHCRVGFDLCADLAIDEVRKAAGLKDQMPHREEKKEVSERQETIADIIAKKRTLAAEMEKALGDQHSSVEMLKDDADRLEAAYKREKAAIEADALSVGGLVEAMRQKEAICTKCRDGEPPKNCQFFGEPDGCSSPTYGHYPQLPIGNAAKLREALSKFCAYSAVVLNTGMFNRVHLEALLNIAKAALAAPPRNCDVYSADELKAKFKSELVSELPIANEHEKNLVTITAMGVIDTLFATTKEGGAK